MLTVYKDFCVFSAVCRRRVRQMTIKKEDGRRQKLHGRAPYAEIREQSNSPTLLIAACIITAAVLGCGPIRNLDAHVSNGE